MLERILVEAWRRRGPIAVALWPLAVVFALVAGLRRVTYRLGLRTPVRLPVPVVVVGNLIVGGAGKTPTVIAVVSLLRRAGFVPGIVSRGWGRADDRTIAAVEPGASASAVGDEPLLLRRRTGAPVVVGRDRVGAARELLRRHSDVDVLVSDDGLQHLRLARDAQVLVFDERGAGNGWMLPAGPLRQRLPASVPPRTVVLYNAATPSTPLAGHLARRCLGAIVGLADWQSERRERQVPIDDLRGRRLLAAAGIAQPQRFFGMLAAAGLSFDVLPLADHQQYATLPWPATTREVVTTEKDAVKLDAAAVGATTVWVVALDFSTPETFDAALLDLLRSSPVARRAKTRSGPDHGNSPA